MENQLKIIKNHRKILLSLIENLTQKQLWIIPDGYSNNIIWNLGHILVTQQLLSYGLSNVPFVIDQKLIEKYRKGSSITENISTEDFIELKKLFLETINCFEQDIIEKKFDNFTQYQTSMGLVLNSIEEAIPFIAYHEGIHFGIILSMIKKLSLDKLVITNENEK